MRTLFRRFLAQTDCSGLISLLEQSVIIAVSYTHLDVYKRQALNISKAEATLSANIFERFKDIPLVDKYEAYQLSLIHIFP